MRGKVASLLTSAPISLKLSAMALYGRLLPAIQWTCQSETPSRRLVTRESKLRAGGGRRLCRSSRKTSTSSACCRGAISGTAALPSLTKASSPQECSSSSLKFHRSNLIQMKCLSRSLKLEAQLHQHGSLQRRASPMESGEGGANRNKMWLGPHVLGNRGARLGGRRRLRFLTARLRGAEWLMSTSAHTRWPAGSATMKSRRVYPVKSHELPCFEVAPWLDISRACPSPPTHHHSHSPFTSPSLLLVAKQLPRSLGDCLWGLFCLQVASEIRSFAPCKHPPV
jgi:hypothetical protein